MTHGHDHHHGAHGDRRSLTVALAIVSAFFVAEVVAGFLADSLALLSDAAHMLTDAGALGLALVAAGLATRAPSGPFTFGLRRAEVISAQVNGATLLVLAGVIAYDAVRRLGDPVSADGAVMVVVGLVGAGVNLVTAYVLAPRGQARGRSLNVEGAYQHVLADLYGSAAAIVAGTAILVTGWERADPAAALAVVALMLRSAWKLLRASGRVLLEGTPEGMDASEIGRAMCRSDGVREVHDLHVWEITSGFPALSAHVLVGADDDCHAVRSQLEHVILERFGIGHVTLQVDHEDGLLQITDAR